jgi:LAO/AO transport system kinase
MKRLSEEIKRSDIKSAARLMRLIENEDPSADDVLKELYPFTGNAYVIGITGLPGSGKSTLIDALIKRYSEKGDSLGVIAVDPSSPFTGGSILGDRIRMQQHSLKDEVFIKSLPTKGWKGGISKVTSKMITVMDSMGKDIIIVETAGVGQTEVEVEELAHTTVVVLVGGLGDSIQIIKAGIIEIADIFVINKSDKNESALDLESDLNSLFDLDIGTDVKKYTWKPLVFKTEALSGKGIEELTLGIQRHREFVRNEGLFKNYFVEKAKKDLMQAIMDDISLTLEERLKKEDKYRKMLSDLEKNNIDPYSLAEKIVNSILKKGQEGQSMS